MANSTPDFPTTCFPTPEQELLLKACLELGDSALRSWREWKSRVDFERIDFGSFRLLPLLYRNLLNHRVEDPLLPRMKGIYRYTWSKNVRTLHRLKSLLSFFQQNGVDTVLLKGAALTLFVYKDHGTRFMDDADILVRFEQAPRAIELLLQNSWSQVYGSIKPFIPYFHGTEFKDSRGVVIDLHWHLLTHCCSSSDDEIFWQKVRPVEMEGGVAHVLHPSDQLLHLCIHGTRWNLVHPVRWVADSLLLLRASSQEIDWNRIVSLAQRMNLSIRLKAALSYLAERFEAPIPAKTLVELAEIRSPKWERTEYETELKKRPWSSEFGVLWHRYHRTGLEKKYRFKPYGFLKYLQYYRGLDHAWEVPIYLMKRFVAGARQNLKQKTAGNHE